MIIWIEGEDLEKIRLTIEGPLYSESAKLEKAMTLTNLLFEYTNAESVIIERVHEQE